MLRAYLEQSSFDAQLENVSPSPAHYHEQLAIVRAFVDWVERHQTDATDTIKKVANLLIDLAARSSDNALLITSVHRAKGLAWPFVIVPALAETTFPYHREDKPVDDAAERRLFNVAITRAKSRLALIAPDDPLLAQAITHHQRIDTTKIHHIPTRASRFLYEANLLSAITLAKMIEANNYDFPMAPTDAHVLMNQYLTHLALPMSVNARAQT